LTRAAGSDSGGLLLWGVSMGRVKARSTATDGIDGLFGVLLAIVA
jgi:hypothetical protein